MIDNNSMYSGPSSPEYEQPNEEVQVTEESVLSQIFDENNSPTLSTQQDNTLNLSEENRLLKEQLETLQREFNSFKETAQYVQNESLVNEVNQMRQIVAEARRAEREKAVVPVIETLKEMGVPIKDVPDVFKEVKSTYGVDLSVTPNVDLVRYHIQNSNWANPANTYNTPKGGYYQPQSNTYYNQTMTSPQYSYDEASYQAKLEAKRKEIWEEAKKRYSK